MSKLKSVCAAVILSGLATGALAQSSSMSGGSMGSNSGSMTSSSGAMSSSHMTKSQMAMMHKCQAMSHDAMMKNAKCAKMMKMHPDMMSNGAMGH